MKILQVVPYYPPHVGGMEFYVQYLSEHLAKMGHQVKVITSSDRHFSYTQQMNGVEVCRLKQSTKFYNVPIPTSLFTNLLREEKPDIIDAHQYPVYFSDVAALVSSLKKTPLVLHVHVVPDAKSIISDFVLKFYYGIFERFTLRASSCIIAPSVAYEIILAKMGVELKKITMVPYGVDLERFNPSQDSEDFCKRFGCEDSKIILTVGRLNYQKGFHYLIRAMPLILRSVPNAKLLIVGNGELLPSLVDLTNSLGLSKNIVFTGALPQSTVSQAYASASVFVLPSLFESLGISLLEAQAMEKPVVGTRVGGLPEALAEGKSGILVEPMNPYALAKATIRILLDEKLAKSMGKYGRKFVEERYDLAKSIGNVVEIYENALKK